MQNDRWPKISIITCTYNCAQHLEKALHSVEAQSYPNLEHIFNDGFSTDGTLEIIKAYARRNRHRYPIRFMLSPSRGVANALNIATIKASGDIIHYLHGDDYYFSRDALERVAAYFKRYPQTVWLTGNFLVEIGGRQFHIPHTHLLRADPERAISAMNFIHHENTFMQREAVQAYGGFNEDKRSVVEYGLWLRLIRDHKPRIVNEVFTVFIIHKGSTSTGNIFRFAKAVLRAFHTQREEKVIPLIGHYPEKKGYQRYRKALRSVRRMLAMLDFNNIRF
jgi:glycosyltransferase involved in cell wall biosynthesis